MSGDARTPVEELGGRELDAAVAREVMGMRVVTDDWPCEDPSVENQRCEYHAKQYQDDPGEGDYVYLPEGEFYCGPWPPNENGYSDVKVVPFYSSEIGAAWDVAERLHIGVFPHPDYPEWADTDEKYVAGWQDKHATAPWMEAWLYGNGDTWATAPTAPEAICRAALMAVRANR